MSELSPAGRPEWNDEDYSILLGAIERLETAWKELRTPDLAEFLPAPPGDPRSVRMLVRLIEVDRRWRCRRGMAKAMAAYVAQWPELDGNAELAGMFDETIAQPARSPSAEDAAHDRTALAWPAGAVQPWAIRILCPSCQQRIEVVDDSPNHEMQCPSCGSDFSLTDRGIPLDHSQGSPARIRRRVAHFELVEQLGMGAFGSVWKALDTELDKFVALKIPRASQLDPDASERFIREARAASRLLHPNIVNVQAVGRDGDLLYIVSEFIDGPSMDKWKVGRTMNFPDSARLCAKVADALQFAHEHGVVHRDLKPQNILMDEAGEPHLTDFGLAKRETEMTMTIEGQILGTPHYIPPEQAGGRSHEADGRSDIYSLGVMLFELLTSVVPFQGNRIAVCRQHEESEPPAPRGLNHLIPRDLETICLKCLEKASRNRYQTAKELAEELRRYLNREPILARSVSRPERLWRWCKRQPLVAGLTAAVALTLMAGTLVSSTFAISAYKEKNRAEVQLLRARTSQYSSQIRLGHRYLLDGEFADSEELLNGCALDLRGWEHQYLWSRFRNPKVVLHGHEGQVNCVAFSPDGRQIVSGAGALAGPGEIKVWDALTGQETITLSGNTAGVSSVAFSPSGRQVVSGSLDGTVKVWDVARGERSLTLKGGMEMVFSVAFSPDGKRIAARADVTIKIWDATTGKEIVTIPLGRRDLSEATIVFSPDGKRIVSGSNQTGSESPMVKVWDVATGEEMLTLTASTNASSVAFSPDGKRIAAGFYHSMGNTTFVDAGLGVWDAATGKQMLALKGGYGVVFSPDGKRIASGSVNGTVKVWDVATGEGVLLFRGSDKSPVLSVAFSPDGRWIAANNLKTVKVWNAATGLESLTHGSGVDSVAFSPDGQWIASGSHDTTLKIWNATTGRETLRLEGHTGRVSSVAYSPDGRRIVSGSHDYTLKVWDATTGKETLTLKGHRAPVNSVAFSPDGRHIVSGSGHWVSSVDNTARVWDATTGQEILTLKGHTSGVKSVAFSPDGKRIVSGSYATFDLNAEWLSDATVKVWDAATGQENSTLLGNRAGISSVVFSPDGKWIAAGSYGMIAGGQRISDATVKVWDAATGQETLTLTGHTRPVCSVAFSPDGKRLVSGSDDKTVKVWDIVTGQEMLTLTGNTEPVNCVAFSPDGRRIISGSEDGTLKVWDSATGLETSETQASP